MSQSFRVGRYYRDHYPTLSGDSEESEALLEVPSGLCFAVDSDRPGLPSEPP